jgi:hypothetical protein
VAPGEACVVRSGTRLERSRALLRTLEDVSSVARNRSLHDALGATGNVVTIVESMFERFAAEYHGEKYVPLRVCGVEHT